jgi:hypothetical protein
MTIALVSVLACAGSTSSRLNPPAGAPPDIQAACAVAAHRCTQCHTIDRVLLARVESPRHWEYYVTRMRRQPHSGISADDERIILRCLIARSFGVGAVDGAQ